MRGVATSFLLTRSGRIRGNNAGEMLTGGLLCDAGAPATVFSDSQLRGKET
jgi:hypothetical protein